MSMVRCFFHEEGRKAGTGQGSRTVRGLRLIDDLRSDPVSCIAKNEKPILRFMPSCLPHEKARRLGQPLMPALADSGGAFLMKRAAEEAALAALRDRAWRHGPSSTSVVQRE